MAYVSSRSAAVLVWGEGPEEWPVCGDENWNGLGGIGGGGPGMAVEVAGP